MNATPRHLEVFDPALCCSSGVCGPRVDPRLLKIASDLKWVAQQGVKVSRYNLAQQPAAFAANETVRSALAAEPETCLPLVLVDGVVASRGAYPTRAELAARLGLTLPPAPPQE